MKILCSYYLIAPFTESIFIVIKQNNKLIQKRLLIPRLPYPCFCAAFCVVLSVVVKLFILVAFLLNGCLWLHYL